VPFGLVNCTHRFMTESANAAPASTIFAEVLGEPVTRASLCDAIRRALALLRLAGTVSIDYEGHVR
jgi:hypothetical protein